MPDLTRPDPWLSAEEAADHLSIRETAFRRGVKIGRFPPPSYNAGPRTPRWRLSWLDGAMTGGPDRTDARGAFEGLADEIAREKGRSGRQAQAR